MLRSSAGKPLPRAAVGRGLGRAAVGCARIRTRARARTEGGGVAGDELAAEEDRLDAAGTAEDCDEPFAPGDFLAAVVYHQLRGVQHDADSPPDQADRHRVAVHPDTDLAVAVDPRSGEPARLERLLRQGHQQRLLGSEVLADGARTGADAAGVVLVVPPVDHRVELGERVDFGDGDQVVAAEPADLALDRD
ncbi:hypothetical protein AB0D45_10725 [Streptomyces sp. NPDC048352]|uniref:hypothetical protein n=1 Tax=Streptomyces sp. NPDC048352 TaxID=3154718 RepID=UPI003442C201